GVMKYQKVGDYRLAAGGNGQPGKCLLFLCIIFLPPIAVYLKDNSQCRKYAWICAFLMLLLGAGWIYAVWFCCCRKG
ncbi:hypothetical protein PENTCL1PPCAC_10852, partial [Pristionchus entomophagus]